MSPHTDFNPTPTLPGIITAPPTAQFTPGPGCVDPEDHWVVVTSCYAQALGEAYSIYPSPDWLTCQFTQFGPPEGGPASCYVPYSAQTVVDAETRFYSDCPSGYAGVATQEYTGPGGFESDVHVFCCPTQYNFNADEYFTGGFTEFITERDGVSYSVGYPLPGCATSNIAELSGKEIPLQTQVNTGAWEKRQISNVPWDASGTMYAEIQSYSYTVFHSTHTCYHDCQGWYDYYFSGSAMPPFTVMDPAPTSTELPPVEQTSQVEEPSSIEETTEPSTLPRSIQDASSPDGEASPTFTAPFRPSPLPGSSESIGNIISSSLSSSSPTTSDVTTTSEVTATSEVKTISDAITASNTPTGAAAVLTPTRLVILGLLTSLIAL
ncbi:hypothetical protein GGS24DRAFT_409278 [Hypoxylon argillaceum]|nr:hypothetical protein GGS24DRAFT_409278 [Hypoxylon argillaceum]